MVHGIVEDVVEGVVVLLLGFDHPRPEALPEDVVHAAVALVERPRVLAVQVAHAVGEIREGRLDHEVVVVPEQAARVESPAVALPDALQDLDEDGAVPVVEEDWFVVVPFGSDVVVRAGGEVAVRPSHRGDRSAGGRQKRAASTFRYRAVTDSSRARHETRAAEARPRQPRSPCRYAATLERSRCWCDGQ